MDGRDWTDRRQRHQVHLEADLMHADGSRTRTLVSELSLEGCRISGWFRIGDFVRLSIPRIGKVRGQVRWAINGQAGIRFLA